MSAVIGHFFIAVDNNMVDNWYMLTSASKVARVAPAPMPIHAWVFIYSCLLLYFVYYYK